MIIRKNKDRTQHRIKEMKMKKTVLRTMLVAILAMYGTATYAQTDLGGILSGILGSGSSDGKGDLLSGLSTIFNANKTAKAKDLAGTWSYSEPAIVFTSDNVLTRVGGKAASQKLEKQIQAKLDSYGITTGTLKMTFSEDGKFTQTLGKKTVSGTYTCSGKTSY